MVEWASQSSATPPSDGVALLRLLIEAADLPACFGALRALLPRVLPATRVDVLSSRRRDRDSLLFTSGGESSRPPAHSIATAAGYAEWLRVRGYSSITSLPIAAGGEHFGWLVLARAHRPLDLAASDLGGQIAAALAARMLQDDLHDRLATREAQITQLEQRLRETEALRDRAVLVAGAAHDISNLLSAVAGRALLLEQEGAATRDDLSILAQAARDAQHLLRRITTASQPTAEVVPAPVATVGRVVRDVLELTRPLWEGRDDIRITTAIGPVPPVRAHGAELREALMNILLNALEAMPEGGTLTIRAQQLDDRVRIEVADTGRGVPPELHEAIFAPLVTTHPGGGGIGLSISRAVIERLGGRMALHSEPGQGATFMIDLPALRSLGGFREASAP